MPDRRVSELPPVSTVADADVLKVVAASVSSKITVANLRTVVAGAAQTAANNAQTAANAAAATASSASTTANTALTTANSASTTATAANTAASAAQSSANAAQTTADAATTDLASLNRIDDTVTVADVGNAVPAGFSFGFNPATGDRFYRNAGGNWAQVPTGGGGGTAEVDNTVTVADIGSAAGAGIVWGFNPATGDTFYVDAGGNFQAVPDDDSQNADEVDNTITAADVGNAVPAGIEWGFDPATGNRFYRNNAGNWAQVPTGGGGSAEIDDTYTTAQNGNAAPAGIAFGVNPNTGDRGYVDNAGNWQSVPAPAGAATHAYVANVAALRALDTSTWQIANTDNKNMAPSYVWVGTNQSANLDPAMVIAPNSDLTGASGAWRALALDARLEWWHSDTVTISAGTEMLATLQNATTWCVANNVKHLRSDLDFTLTGTWIPGTMTYEFNGEITVGSNTTRIDVGRDVHFSEIRLKTSATYSGVLFRIFGEGSGLNGRYTHGRIFIESDGSDSVPGTAFQLCTLAAVGEQLAFVDVHRLYVDGFTIGLHVWNEPGSTLWVNDNNITGDMYNCKTFVLFENEGSGEQSSNTFQLGMQPRKNAGDYDFAVQARAIGVGSGIQANKVELRPLWDWLAEDPLGGFHPVAFQWGVPGDVGEVKDNQTEGRFPAQQFATVNASNTSRVYGDDYKSMSDEAIAPVGHDYGTIIGDTNNVLADIDSKLASAITLQGDCTQWTANDLKAFLGLHSGALPVARNIDVGSIDFDFGIDNVFDDLKSVGVIFDGDGQFTQYVEFFVSDDGVAWDPVNVSKAHPNVRRLGSAHVCSHNSTNSANGKFRHLRIAFDNDGAATAVRPQKMYAAFKEWDGVAPWLSGGFLPQAPVDTGGTRRPIVIPGPGQIEVGGLAVGGGGASNEIDNTYTTADIGNAAPAGVEWGINPATGDRGYVNGAGDWAAVVGGGGGTGTYALDVTTADRTKNNTNDTASTVDQMAITLTAGTWKVSAALAIIGDEGGDFAARMNATAGLAASTARFIVDGGLPGDATPTAGGGRRQAVQFATSVNAGTEIGQGSIQKWDGVLVVTTPGVLTLTWAQDTQNVSDTTLQSGSMLEATLIA